MYTVRPRIPTPTAVDDACVALAGRLRRELVGLEQVLLIGSCSRRTALPSTYDVDLLIVLDERAHFAARHRGPESCLDMLNAAVQRAFPMRGALRLQNRSVRLRMSTTGRCFDLVPAFRHPCWPRVYVIADRRRDRWILTCPEGHTRIKQDADRRTRHLFNPIVRIAKTWNYVHGKLLSSFHLEALAYRALAAPPRDIHHGLSLLLSGLADAVMQTCPDPAAVGPPIDEDVDDTQRRLARAALLAAIEQTRDAAMLGATSLAARCRQSGGT